MGRRAGLTDGPRPACTPASPGRRAPGSPRAQNPRAPSPMSGAAAGGRSTRARSSAPAESVRGVRPRPGSRLPAAHMHACTRTRTHTHIRVAAQGTHAQHSQAAQGRVTWRRHWPRTPANGAPCPPLSGPCQVSHPGPPRGPSFHSPKHLQTSGTQPGLSSAEPRSRPRSQPSVPCRPAPLASVDT